MSSDGKEPSPIWQNPANSSWEQPVDPAQSIDQNTPPLPAQQQEQAFQFHTPPPVEEEENRPARAESAPATILKQIIQYAILILAPLLFAGLTALFVLPLIAAGQVFIRPEGFWLVVAIIVMIAIAQSIAVYFAGANNGLWALATIGGFCLFLLVGTFTIFGPGLAAILLLILLAISWALARFYFHPVPEGFVDIVYAFGKYSRTLYPGFNIILPWEKVLQQLNVTETQWTTPLQQVQLSAAQDVVLRGTISYQLLPEDAHLAVTQVRRWEESLQDSFVQCIQSAATSFMPDDFIPWREGLQPIQTARGASQSGSNVRWEHINSHLFQVMRDKVALWGVVIHQVRIRDVMLAPHGVTFSNASASSSPEDTTIISSAQQEKGTPKASPLSAAEKPLVVQAAAGQTTPPVVITEQALKKAYKQVQDGNIKDPEIIRSIAAQFEAVARDPKANQNVNFDAARAALNLYEQAQKYEQEQQQVPVHSEVRRDWHPRPPNDDNRMGGG